MEASISIIFYNNNNDDSGYNSDRDEGINFYHIFTKQN